MANESSFKVLIAGGGVAGVEAMLALRELLGDSAELQLLAPATHFVDRPLAVVEPFGRGQARRVPLARIAADCAAMHRIDRLAGVDPDGRTATTGGGDEIAYDALLLALGTRAEEAVPGAISYRGGRDTDVVRAMLDRVAKGESRRVVFAAPATVRWVLPLYELAMLTAAELADRVEDLSLTVVTPEAAPLDAFGNRASQAIRASLADAGVELITRTAPSAVHGRELTLARGDSLPADEVVSLPRLSVEPIPGIVQGPEGFIGTDRFMRVEQAPRVYAAGDATWFPIKQGGLAAQQADVAAASIAALRHGESPQVPFRPVLRGAVLTASTPRYLRSEIGDRNGSSAGSAAPLWWPPAKVAGRLLAPYLRSLAHEEAAPPLGDVEPLHGEDILEAEKDHRDVVELALASAEGDARLRDFDGALRWLDIAEGLDLALPASYSQKRRRWQDELRAQQNA